MDPGAPSGAVAEITLTAGTGPYQLSAGPPGGPLAQYFRFADVFVDGALLTYEVDDTAKKEIVEGTFHLGANTLSRDTVLFSSNGNVPIDWPVTGQRTVRPLVGFPLCDTPPLDGQVLAWDAAIKKYCPTTIVAPSSGSSNVFYISFSYGSTFQSLPSDPFDNNLEIFDMVAPTSITFPANLSTSPTPICEVAPTFDVQFNIDSYVGGVQTSRGLLKYASGSTTGTYTFTPFTLAAGGRLRLYVQPIQDDGVIAGIAGTIVGTR